MNSNLKYILIFLGIIHVIGIGLLAYYFFIYNVNDDKSVNNVEFINTQVFSNKGSMFWVKNTEDNSRTVLYGWVDGNEKELYSVDNPSNSRSVFTIISSDNEDVYLRRNDANDSIFVMERYSLGTDTLTTIYSGDYMHSPVFYNENYMFYAKDKDDQSRVSLYLYNIDLGKETYILDINARTFRTGPTTYETINLELSKDKTKLLYINASETGNPTSRTTYIYDINKDDSNMFRVKLSSTIPNSAGSKWIGDSRVVYLKMTNESPNGAYVFNTLTQTSEILDKVEVDGFDFSISPDGSKLLYRKGDILDNALQSKLYIYDFNSDTNELFADALRGFWINDFLVAVYKYNECNECEMISINLDNIKILRVDNKEVLFVLDGDIRSHL